MRTAGGVSVMLSISFLAGTTAGITGAFFASELIPLLGSSACDVQMQEILALLKSFLCFTIVSTIFIGTIVGGARNIEESNTFPRSHVSIGNGQFLTELSKARLGILKNVSIGDPSPKEKMHLSFFDTCYYVWPNNKRAGRSCGFGCN
jgi:hypothetical protein